MNNLQLENLFQSCLVLLLMAYVIYKQIALRPVKSRKYIIFPIIFLFLTIRALNSLGEDTLYSELAPITLLTSVGLVSGLASGMVTKIFRGEDGVLYQKGGLVVAVLLLFTIPIRYMLRHSIASLPGAVVLNSTGISYLIMVSSQLIGRNLTILIKYPQVLDLFF